MEQQFQIEGQQDREELVKILAFNGYKVYVKYDAFTKQFFVVVDTMKSNI